MAAYSTLVAAKTTEGSIKAWVNRTDIPSTIILTEAEALICQRLRVREMMAREAPFTFDASTQTEALPTGFLDPISFRPYTWSEPLPFVHEDGLDEYRDSDGVLQSGDPSRWTVVGETAYVDVLPSSAYSGILLYYKKPTALSDSNETNFLTERYPTLLRYACMAKAYEFMKDPQKNDYLALTAQEIAEANATNEMWRRSQYVPA